MKTSCFRTWRASPFRNKALMAALLSACLWSGAVTRGLPPSWGKAYAERRAAVKEARPNGRDEAPSGSTINESAGWKLVYMAGGGLPARGSARVLREAVKTHPVGIKIPTFHGMISGVCESVRIVRGGVVDCQALIWCNHPNALLAAHHGHRVHVRSNGSMDYAVIELNDWKEEKILALGESNAMIAWYIR